MTDVLVISGGSRFAEAPARSAQSAIGSTPSPLGYARTPNRLQRMALPSTRLAPSRANRCCDRERGGARVSGGQRPAPLRHLPDQPRGIRHARRVGDADRALLDHGLLQERPV
jgi:hypothetical protein